MQESTIATDAASPMLNIAGTHQTNTQNHYCRKISPTDISQFVRLDQCKRYLALALKLRGTGREFMKAYGVATQAIPPLLTRSGDGFENQIEEAVATHFTNFNFSDEPVKDEDNAERKKDNERLIAMVKALCPGEVYILFQVRVVVKLADWEVRGDIDILRLELDQDNRLQILIADMKSSVRPKMEHRLQVAFYQAMIKELLDQENIGISQLDTAILYRGVPGAIAGLDEIEAARIRQHEAQALHYFSLENSFLEVVSPEDQLAYLESVSDLVIGSDSIATQVSKTELGQLPYHLDNKCSGCVFNEHCMKWSAEHDDLSLLPHLTALDKEALRQNGVTTTQQLASLKDLIKQAATGAGTTPSYKLVPAAGQESLARQLSTIWPVGPHLDELIHRSRLYRHWKKEQVEALNYIPSKGHGSLPFTSPTHNPNLVRIYLDVQYDYLQDRLYLLGALVSGCENGVAVPQRRRSIVRITDGPPDNVEKEARLLLDWIQSVLTAVVEIAAPDPITGEKKAPIHLIFYNHADQKILLDGLARHLSSLLGATPLYDFMTQLPALDSPLVTYLDGEIRELKNYPMVCQSLQQVAGYLGFNWRQGYSPTGQPIDENYRDLFNERMFDFWGKLEQNSVPQAPSETEVAPASGWKWYNSRARFNSEIPLEYVYAAWGKLGQPSNSTRNKRDPFALYRHVNNTECLLRFQARRLEAIEHITGQFFGNRLTEKGCFVLPDLANFEQKARSLAHALEEFVTIEHHVELGGWKSTRNLSPERRLLMGEALLVRYQEEDQLPEIITQNRENVRRQRLKDEYYAHQPEGDQELKPSKAEKDQWKWSQEGMRVQFRIDLEGVDCELNEALLVSNFREGHRVVLYPRWSQDTRLPIEERTDNTPTPRQMLYGCRADIIKIIQERDDAAGKTMAAWVELEMQVSRGGPHLKGFAFGSIDRPLEAGKLYTIDADPNNFYGYWGAVVAEELRNLEEKTTTGQNVLYTRLSRPQTNLTPLNWPQAAQDGQARFLDGLQALKDIRALHDFEPGKLEYIGQHGATPVLLVQGPPGTGKSYSTGFAIFARLQGALAAGLPYRVLVSCKTHAATDVLLHNVLTVQDKLKQLKQAHPSVVARYFDERLLEVPLYRLGAREKVSESDSKAAIIYLPKDGERAKGEPSNFKVLTATSYSVTGATPGGVYRLAKDNAKKNSELFKLEFLNCVVLDEASQMNLPEAAMATLPLHQEGQLIVVGDPRQMPPIVKHNWDSEPRRTFQEYKSYQSLFNAFLDLSLPGSQKLPIIRFEESFRLHAAMADFLKQEIYRLDGINYHSQREKLLPNIKHPDPFVAAALASNYPLVVIVHEESASQTKNDYERRLIGPVLEALADKNYYKLEPSEGLGVVVPHRAQRAALQESYPWLTEIDQPTGTVRLSAVDTVERFQGGERRVIVVSATESDPAYLLAAGSFLYDPRRLTVAISRAKEKLILVASRSVFSLFSPDEQTFANGQLWKNLLKRKCTVKLWAGEREGHGVEVWGNS